MRARFINEEAGTKDIARIENIITKSKGDVDKEIMFAMNMARSIKNPGKAQARGEAAEQVYGRTNEISDIFYDRANELSGGQGVVGEPSKMPGEKKDGIDWSQWAMPASEIASGGSEGGFQEGGNPYQKMKVGQYSTDIKIDRSDHPKHNGRFWGNGGISILTIGTVNLMTGASEYFNIYETWDGDDTTCEIWKNEAGKYKIMITSGNKPLYSINETGSFMADQSRRYLYDATMVDYALLKDTPGLARLYGKRLGGYVYK